MWCEMVMNARHARLPETVLSCPRIPFGLMRGLELVHNQVRQGMMESKFSREVTASCTKLASRCVVDTEWHCKGMRPRERTELVREVEWCLRGDEDIAMFRSWLAWVRVLLRAGKKGKIVDYRVQRASLSINDVVCALGILFYSFLWTNKCFFLFSFKF
jgi:hypothetical protein